MWRLVAILKARNMKFGDAREYLQQLSGVGSKVAGCTLLYGFGMIESFLCEL